MAKIYIDGKTHEVPSGKNLLDTCLSLGYDLPYFCWHPALGSVGACRQCAVLKFKDESDQTGKLTMACMEPISDNLRISIGEPEAVRFRKNVIEWLMVNHPHDCPVCDEGGECHLQDMTVMTGHNYRRYDFRKRTYRNQYLGPFINHEMNRCIQCYRCVRFYRDHADGHDFNVFSAHDHVYFGRQKDGVLENEFSGNLVEICPTGVFTDKTLKKHYTRKWDLTTAPSICNQCGLGCNIIAGERYGSLRRILSRYNGRVNGYFICDRGRYGYEYVNDPGRIREPLQFDRETNSRTAISEDELTKICRKLLAPSKKIAGIGSPKASLEANFALQLLVSGGEFYGGITRKELTLIKRIQKIFRENQVETPSMKDVEKSDAVFILGEDLTNTAPMLALAVRQASRSQPARNAEKLRIPAWQDAAIREVVQYDRGPVFIATPNPTKLDDIASEKYRAVAENIARLGFAVAHEIDKDAPSADLPSPLKGLVRKIAGALMKAESPVIISGTSLVNESLLDAASNITQALHKRNINARLSFTVPEANSMGLAMMTDKSIDDLISDTEKNYLDTLVILENDLFHRVTGEKMKKLHAATNNIIVMDYLMNKTVEMADYVVPVGSFAESDGTYINNEGRAQRFYQVYKPEGEMWEDWRWISKIAGRMKDRKGRKLINYYDFLESMVDTLDQFKGIQNITPPPGFRLNGQKIPREPHRFSGRTAMNANKHVSESKPPEDPDSPLSFTMEGYVGKPPSSVIPFFWSPGWNSVQSINKYQIEVGGPLHGGDPGLRLFEPSDKRKIKYSENIPDRLDYNGQAIQAEPVYHIFGSEELSIHTKGIAELAPSPYIAINEALAKQLNAKNDDMLVVEIDNEKYNLKARITIGIPEGVALIPVGLQELPSVILNKHIKVENKPK